MDAETFRWFESRAKVVKLMAHPTRLFILDQLSSGEHCVQDLTEKVGADISTVSKHLSLLKTAGIVEDDKRGNQVFYSLGVPCVLNVFACVDEILTSQSKQHVSVL